MPTTTGGAKSYSFKRFAITVNGTPVSGFQDGDAVSIDFAQDTVNMVEGVDGEVMYTESSANAGEITMSLLYSSLANDRFREIFEAGSIVSLSIRDLVGGTKIEAPTAKVARIPAITLGREPGVMEWMFKCARIKAQPKGLRAETATP